MSKKRKAYLPVLIMSVLFFMMIDTRYARPLGDYVFEFLGLNSWTGDQTGLHLSVIFFGVVFLVAIQFVQKYAMDELNMSWKRIVVYSFGLTSFFSFATGIVAKSIKANAGGLLAIGIEKRSNLSYEFNGERYTQYDVDITLKNYSNEEQAFYLILDDPAGMGSAQLYNVDGDEKFFRLQGKEQKTFSITAENAQLKEMNLPDYDWASGNGSIDRLILSNESGEKVQMTDSNFIGETLTD